MTLPPWYKPKRTVTAFGLGKLSYEVTTGESERGQPYACLSAELPSGYVRSIAVPAEHVRALADAFTGAALFFERGEQ